MKICCVRHSLYLVFLSLLTQLVGCGVEVDDAQYITQCIIQPDENSKSRQFETLLYGNKAKCHALLWQIPKQHTAHKMDIFGIANHDDESIAGSVSIELANFFNNPSTPALKVLVKRSGDTFDSIKRGKGFPAIGGGLFHQIKVNSSIEGMLQYATDDARNEKKLKLSTFVPSIPWTHLIECYYNPEFSHGNIPPQTLCRVQTDIDGRVYGKYDLRYSQLNDFHKINKTVITSIKHMMLN